jgi:predicted nucleic acid-binding protein
MASDVLVDSNVYINLLRTRRDVVSLLVDWAEARDRSLAICGMIRLEVLRGVKSLKAFHALSALMDVMINIPTDNRLWSEATELAWALDRQGKYIPGPDAVIAAAAMRGGAAIMTSDRHFKAVDGIRVLPPPAEWGIL